MKAKQVLPPRKTGNQIVDEKLKAVNNFLKTADLSVVYEALEKKKTGNTLV